MEEITNRKKLFKNFFRLHNDSLEYNKHILTESVQSVVNLGFPRLIASIFHKEFNRYAYQIALWYKQYYHADKDTFREYETWWSRHMNTSFSREISVYLDLYNSARKSKDAYKKELADNYLTVPADEELTQEFLKEQAEYLKTKIVDSFLKDHFFSYFALIKDIRSGKFHNVSKYKNLNFKEANNKYENERIFVNVPPIKSYDNGYKWIDVGEKSSIIASMMNNCGSTGVMSSDSNRTMIVLFDQNNKAKVVVTYSPNQKRISGDECNSSQKVSDDFHDYVLDLAKVLNVKFDADKSKSAMLSLKYYFRNDLASIKELNPDDMWSDIFEIKLKNGKIIYSNGHVYLPRQQALLLKTNPDVIDLYAKKAKTYGKSFLTFLKTLFDYNLTHILKQQNIIFPHVSKYQD